MWHTGGLAGSEGHSCRHAKMCCWHRCCTSGILHPKCLRCPLYIISSLSACCSLDCPMSYSQAHRWAAQLRCCCPSFMGSLQCRVDASTQCPRGLLSPRDPAVLYRGDTHKRKAAHSLCPAAVGLLTQPPAAVLEKSVTHLHVLCHCCCAHRDAPR